MNNQPGIYYIPFPVPMPANGSFPFGVPFNSLPFNSQTKQEQFTQTNPLETNDTPDFRTKLTPEDHSASAYLSKDLVENYIDSKLPELASSVVNSYFQSGTQQLVEAIAEEVQKQITETLASTVAKEAVKNISDNYLREKTQEKITTGKLDPFAQLVEKYSDGVADSMVEGVAKAAIQEQVGSYIYEGNTNNFLNNHLLPELCSEVINEAGWEVAIENYAESLIEVIIGDFARQAVFEASEDERDTLNSSALEEAFELFLERQILQANTLNLGKFVR